MTGTPRGAWAAAFVAALLLMTAQAQARSARDKCIVKKNTIAGKYAFGLQKAQAKAIKTGAAVDHAAADAKFAKSMMKAELKAAGMYPNNGHRRSSRDPRPRSAES